ncbi:MAG: BrnT family toxin [Gammaproteobacteria bacterium]|nr:MAG: BrnT family toxin [Gammaproteobacteria bacterium]UTW42238.1 BrnT family toxin [bacterium SCSIO 12844]
MFEWDKKKNHILKKTRNITFEEIIEAIENDQIVGIEVSKKYPHQSILCIKVRGYIYAVPIEERGNNIRLVTAFKDRRLNKKYGMDDNE